MSQAPNVVQPESAAQQRRIAARRTPRESGAIRPAAPAHARRWIPGLAVFGVWTLLALLTASQRYIGFLAEPQYRIPWIKALAWQAPVWYFWALATPLILWLGRRFPLERGRWHRGVAVHLAACLVLIPAHAAVYEAASRLLIPGARAGSSFAGQYFGYLTSIVHTDLLVYCAILGFGYAFEFYRRYREREVTAANLEAQLAHAQLQALRMQLNPHFLFNALHAIASLVRKGQGPDAVRMLAGLGELLRHSLDGTDSQEVRLRDELEFLGKYLAIEKIRFGDRLRVTVDVAPELLDARVPNLILQPLVENAIKHGVGPRAAAGAIEIGARRTGGMLELRVADDGPGLPPGWAIDRAGVGLSNTRDRLEKLYGERHRLVLAGRDAGGTVATVAVPYRVAPLEWEAGR